MSSIWNAFPIYPIVLLMLQSSVLVWLSPKSILLCNLLLISYFCKPFCTWGMTHINISWYTVVHQLFHMSVCSTVKVISGRYDVLTIWYSWCSEHTQRLETSCWLNQFTPLLTEWNPGELDFSWVLRKGIRRLIKALQGVVENRTKRLWWKESWECLQSNCLSFTGLPKASCWCQPRLPEFPGWGFVKHRWVR